MFLETIIKAIDGILQSSQSEWLTGGYYGGLAEQMQLEDGVLSPFTRDRKSINELTINDSYTAWCYHRIVGGVKISELIDNQSYGRATENRTYPLQFVCFVRNIDNYTYYYPEAILDVLPQQLDKALLAGLNIQSAYLNASDYNLDRYAVWKQEYGNLPFQHRDGILFSLKYNLILTTQKGCMPRCCP